MSDTEEKALAFLKNELEKRGKREVLGFDEYLELVRQEPQRVLRNILMTLFAN